MAVTPTTVEVGGRGATTIGITKRTITDLAITEPSETVTAADLGLSAVLWARADIVGGVSSNDGTYAKCTVPADQNGLTLALFTADGTAATIDTSTVRVTAHGF